MVDVNRKAGTPSTKCIVITPNGEVTIEKRRNVLSKKIRKSSTSVKLNGLDYLKKGYNLSMLISSRKRSRTINLKATDITTHIEFHLTVNADLKDIYGTVIIVDDSKEITDETWSDIRSEIENRKHKTPPQPQYDNYIKELEKKIHKMKETTQPSAVVKPVEDFLFEAIHYGHYGKECLVPYLALRGLYKLLLLAVATWIIIRSI